MQKVMLAVLVCCACPGVACADVKYTETENVTIVERFYNPVQDVRRNVAPRPCTKKVGEPVRVKTHTEILEHYQVYQPVTIYRPMGTEIQRKVVPAKSCGKCSK